MIVARLAKIFLISVVVILIANFIVIVSIAQTRPKFEQADVAIILGAAINTPALTNRTIEGIRLAEAGRVDLLVLSGGKISDSDISEAEFMQKVIKRFSDGVEINYILEEESGTTYENIRNSKALLQERGIEANASVVIVSDEYHLARGVLLAKRAGFDKVYWTAPEPSYYSRENLRFYYFREFMAMLNYIPKFIFG